MNEIETKKYWMIINTVTWAVILAVSFFVFFPGFVALIIFWATGKIKIAG
jgi:hypothetical protein